MKTLLILSLLMLATSMNLLASDTSDTNRVPLIQFVLLHYDRSRFSCQSLEPDNAWFRFRLSRSPADQQVMNNLLPHPQGFDAKETPSEPAPAPFLTVSQTPRLALVTGTDYNSFFQLLSQIPGLFNFDATYTKLKSSSALQPGMTLQLVLGDFAFRGKYDVEFGPAYTLADNKDCLQFALTIKAIETPALQHAIQKSAFKTVQPIDLSRWYIVLAVGTVYNDWQEWNVSVGFGTQLGN